MARPLSFDKKQALVNAMLVFWHQGYEATSMKDLERATGLVPSSIYNAFGNKEAFFLQVLEHYSQNVLGSRMKKYLKQEDPIKAIHDFFTTCFTDLPRGKHGMACLLVNSISEMALHNSAIRKVLNKSEDALRDNFTTCIQQAKRQKRISNQYDSQIMADQLIITLNGLLVSSKAIKDNNKMVQACYQSLSFILGEDALKVVHK